LAEAASTRIDEIVSSEAEELIVVNGDDEQIAQMSKAACHDGDGVLHRAFSLFIFNRKGELLLQQRSAEKRLWPMFWSNSCCSHPRHGETMDEAIHRRLDQELGMTSELHFLYKFQYQARYEDLGSENELCWVFTGISDDEPRPNHHEIDDFQWMTPAELDAAMAEEPDAFTPWFKMEWQKVREIWANILLG
jgi:isopentenyl-diphosphate delta-isomerase